MRPSSKAGDVIDHFAPNVKLHFDYIFVPSAKIAVDITGQSAEICVFCLASISMTAKTFFVTGGAGFIGSAFVRLLLDELDDCRVINFDALTYAGNPDNLEGLDPETRAEMMELTTRCMTVLRKIYNPQAFNMGANIGEAAGAGVKAHVHIHIVPRWAGDTNFMSTVGDVRVLPESLENTFYRVKKGFEE